MDSRPDIIDDDEISLYDIYVFLRDGWVTLVGMSVLGLAGGLATVLLSPSQYQASAMLEPGKVGFFSRTDGVTSRGLDSPGRLAEKMQLPGFYSESTLQACGFDPSPFAAQGLAQALSPGVPRNSSFVSVSFKADSIELAQNCVQAVLDDVIRDQSEAFSVATNAVKAEITEVGGQIALLRNEREQIKQGRLDGLKAADDQLRTTRGSLQKLDQRLFEEATGADATVVLMLLTLRNDLQELENLVSGLRVSLSSEALGLGSNLPELSERLAGLQLAMQPPNTQVARYVSGINAPASKVGPRSQLIIVLGILIGGFAGLALLIGRRALAHIRELDAQRRGG